MEVNTEMANFYNFYKDEGITSHFTIPKTHQQNGVVERMNKTLLGKKNEHETSYKVA